MLIENVIETGVLIIGGGRGGCFSAIKAREQGVEVLLVDKGYVSRAGQTPFASGTAVFNPEWDHKLDDWINQANTIGEYINNREWNRIVFEESYARYQDLVSWGVKFFKTDSEDPHRAPHPYGAANQTLHWASNHTQCLRRQVLASGAKIMDRIMVTDLLKQDTKVIGAIGIPMDSDDLYIFKAGAVIISAGSGGFKSLGYPTCDLTCDGHMMAYRAGAEIIGKEFIDTHFYGVDHPGYRTFPKPHPEDSRHGARGAPNWTLFDAEGNQVAQRGKSWPMWLELDIEAHAGRAPITTISSYNPNERNIEVGGAAGGMSIHSTDGIRATSTKCTTNLPGLYAAGDSLGTMSVGANYSIIGHATMFAAVTGARAGLSAAEYTYQVNKPKTEKLNLARLKEITHAPIMRKGGFSPAWVTQVLQGTMLPYFVLRIKHGDRLEAALTTIKFLQEHLVPKLVAKDAHELRLAHETKNMVLNAEMKLRASIFRTESRGTHYREDYPHRDDPNWLAWIILGEEQGTMQLRKEEIPKEWWPDLSKSYEEKYLIKFPGE